jgi:hypothetical protein
MKSKPPSEDNDRTAPVGSKRRSQPENLNPVGGAVDDGKTIFVPGLDSGDSDDGRTAFVESLHQPEHSADKGQSMRSAPSPRLPWPARDRHKASGPQSAAGSGTEEDNVPTRPVGGNRPTGISPAMEDEETRLFSPSSSKTRSPGATPSSDPSNASGEVSQKRGEEDPVVGWLVILQGPGKGRSLEIGIGANSVGRDRDQKICLNFGDQEIHRDKHAVVVYDPRSRRFFLQSGDVRNLTYLGDNLVLAPVELKGGETITMGQTQMRFVAFCGPDFGWS